MQEKKQKVARQKKPNRKDNKQVNFRVNEQEYDKLKQSANLHQMSVAQYAKSKAENARLDKPKFDANTSQQILKYLASISNNTNQIAKALNARQDLSAEHINRNLDELRKQLSELWQQLN